MATTHAPRRLPNVLSIGVGEYVTGYVHGHPASSDKAAGVVAVTLFDLRARGIIGDGIGLCGTSGTKMPMLRLHLDTIVGHRYRLDTHVDTWPRDGVDVDTLAYEEAVSRYQAGDVAIITTPDHTHYTIAKTCLAHGLHTLIAKPAVRSIREHAELVELARSRGVVLAVEMHKRFDPFYIDAIQRIASGSLGSLTFFTAYMSQPKTQLATFQSWALDRRNSDISYYLNSHHVDMLTHALSKGMVQCKPVTVYASGSTGAASLALGKSVDIEDSITLTVQFVDTGTGTTGTAVFTACWTAPKGPCHSQQRFHYLGQLSEVSIDQAQRGYVSNIDSAGHSYHNPLFFTYTPDSNGKFAGQNCYGYRSFQLFVEAATLANIAGVDSIASSHSDLALLTTRQSLYVTAILEAGRKSLDEKRIVTIQYDDQQQVTGLQ